MVDTFPIQSLTNSPTLVDHSWLNLFRHHSPQTQQRAFCQNFFKLSIYNRSDYFRMKCGNHNCGNHFIVSSFGNSFAWKEVCVAYCNRLLYNICQIESIKFVPSTINLDRCWISMQLQSKPLIPPTVLNVVGHVQYREYHDNDNEKKLTIFNHLLFSYFCDSFFDLQILTNWTFMFPFQISMSCNHIKPLAHSSK